MTVPNKEIIEIKPKIGELTPPELRNFPRVRYYVFVTFMLVRFLFVVLILDFAISLLIWLPDVDFALSPLLHHRSVVTHSIIVPSLLLVVFRRISLTRPIVSVLFAAISIHLFADTLSPPVGYGQVWLPLPIPVSFGSFSPVWLFVNAIAAAILSIYLMTIKFRSQLVAATLLSGSLYGFANEQSSTSALFIFAMLLASYVLPFKRRWVLVTPRSILRDLAEGRNQELADNASFAEARKLHRLSMGRTKRLALVVWSFICGIYTLFRWLVLHPKKAAASLLAILAVVGTLHFFGKTGNGPKAGAAQTIGNGLWVLHASGGYILSEGGRYVAGTLRPSLP